MLARLRRVPFAAQVLLALVVGVALGLVAREIGPVADGTPNWLTSTLQTVGGTFVTLLKVLVPPGLTVKVVGHVNLGEILLPGDPANNGQGGSDVSRSVVIGDGPTEVVVNAGVGIGQLTVVKE